MIRRLFALAASVVLVAACSERLTSPADCPTICPGTNARIIDTVLLAEPGLDSTFEGYATVLSSGAVLVSNGLPALDARGVLKFTARPDSFTLNGNRRGYLIDSIAVNVGLLARDTLRTGLEFRLFRLPVATDTSITFAQVRTAEANGPTVRVPVPDTLRAGFARTVVRGAALDSFRIAAADSGVYAFALGIDAPTPTGVRVQGSVSITSSTTIVTYISLQGDGVDSTNRRQILTLVPTTGFYVAAPRPAAPTGALLVGGEPAARSVLRFRLPQVIRDSAAIVRATLELVPVGPVQGVPNQPTTLQIRAVQTDLGAKSPLIGQALASAVSDGQRDTLRLEVAGLVQLWQGANGTSPSVFLSVLPEGGAWSRLAFGSSRTGVAPRLRISYLRPYRFEVP